MRLIDADNLKNHVKAIHKAVDTTSVNTDYDTGFHSATSQIMGLIEFLPTVEAKEVVHAKWKRTTVFNENNNAVYECTNCLHRDLHGKDVVVPFCWFCGADMRTSAE